MLTLGRRRGDKTTDKMNKLKALSKLYFDFLA